LSNKPDQISGFRKNVANPYERFVAGMRESYPDLLEQSLEELQKKTDGKKRKWEDIVHGKTEDTPDGDDNGGGFSFGFGDDGSDVEVP
jgi:hypothetical protein